MTRDWAPSGTAAWCRTIVVRRWLDMPASTSEIDEPWLETLAGAVLHDEERPCWRQLTSRPPRRRLEWLIGRVAAKEAVRALVPDPPAGPLSGADVAIIRDSLGRPVVSAGWSSERPAPAVTIAHTRTVVVAAAAERPPCTEWALMLSRWPRYPTTSSDSCSPGMSAAFSTESIRPTEPSGPHACGAPRRQSPRPW
jgi:phosphopantetheinyl transferase (holo-ACP synthase)